MKEKIDLNYLKEIPAIKEYLEISDKKTTSLDNYLLSLNKFFPTVMKHFKEKDPTKAFEKWKELTPNFKSNLLMKWVNTLSEKTENDEKKKRTWLNYMWLVQGFLGKLGDEYSGNPKTLEKIGASEMHIGAEDISYDDVVMLYEKLDNVKYKMILKVMMYTGLNPVDILTWRPSDFKPIGVLNKVDYNSSFYYLVKTREKTEKKKVMYLIVLPKEFVIELKEYFERKIIVQINKKISKKKEELFSNDKHYSVMKNDSGHDLETNNYVKYEGKFSWEYDKDRKLFNNDISSNDVSNAIKYHVRKNNLNKKLMPQTIRRLCFTRLREVFSLKDADILTVWSQHKAGILTENYTTDLLQRIIPYFHTGKLQEAILIGSMGNYIRENNELKVKEQKIYELENTLSKMGDVIVSLFNKVYEIEDSVGVTSYSVEFEDGEEDMTKEERMKNLKAIKERSMKKASDLNMIVKSTSTKDKLTLINEFIKKENDSKKE